MFRTLSYAFSKPLWYGPSFSHPSFSRSCYDTFEGGPNPVFHRDIRWPNVIRHIHNSRKWFLIDWEDASILPTHAASHLENQAHSPQVSKDGYGADVDVWAVGMLILDARSFAPPLSSDMIAVGKRMMDDAGMSAAQAVQEIGCTLY
jgi:hypothetical protein